MKGQVRTVLAVFCAVAAVLALGFFLVGRVLIPDTGEPVSLSDALRLLFENDRSPALLPESPPVFPEEDTTVTVLLMGLDYRPEEFDDYRMDAPATPGALGTHSRKIEADFIAVLCVNTESKEISVIAIPEDSVISLSGTDTPLRQVYGDYGEDYFCRLIAALVGFEIDYRLAVNVCDVGRIVELAGNAVVSVPCNMYLENKQYTSAPKSAGATLLLEAGDRYITKENAVWLLSFDDYENGGSRVSTVLTFANALMARFTTLENLLRIDELYTAVSRVVSTNVTIEDVRDHISILLSYASYSIKSQTYPGTYSADREVFYPDTEEALAAFTPYR
ncbi:MAG: LCP family protein [Clostridia bacterium]|nr:LCP family protein [Clostridia bacterium]